MNIASTSPPPTPAEADLTHYDDMPLEVRRLRDSGIAGAPDAEVFRCAVLLWCAAWHQVPAGSLPKSDADLCRMVGMGRDLKGWAKIRNEVLRGWYEFADGRLYHRVVSEKVIVAWNSTREHNWRKACDRARKENNVRKKQHLGELPLPPKPPPCVLQWPASFHVNSSGIPPETPKPSGGNPSETAQPFEGIPSDLALNRMEWNKDKPETESGSARGAPRAVARSARSAVSEAMTAQLEELAERRRNAA